LLPEKLSDESLQRLLALTRRDDKSDRREDVRHPLFAPFTVTGINDSRRYTAFSREVSAGGIGLLHAMPIEAGTTCVLRLHDLEASFIRPAEVVWCAPAGEGWYLSGWRFLGPGC
jgi:hypothetical protein